MEHPVHTETHNVGDLYINYGTPHTIIYGVQVDQKLAGSGMQGIFIKKICCKISIPEGIHISTLDF